MSATARPETAPDRDAERDRWRKPFDDQIAEAMATYERTVAQAAAVRRELQDARVTKTSKKRGLTVTVDVRGKVLEAKFTGTGYRELTPVELSALVTETVTEAQSEATREAQRIIAPLKAPAVPIEAILDGK